MEFRGQLLRLAFVALVLSLFWYKRSVSSELPPVLLTRRVRKE